MNSGDLSTRKLNRSSNIIVREEENCYLLVNRNSGKVLVINDVGLKIWNYLPDLTINAIVEKLAKEYKVAKTLSEKEVIKFARKILENHFAVLT